MGKVFLMIPKSNSVLSTLTHPRQWKSLVVQGVIAASGLVFTAGLLGVAAWDNMVLPATSPLYNSPRNLEIRANTNDTEAQFRLANLYYAGGPGIKQDDGKAIAWYKRAGLGGHPMAQYQLALILQNANDENGAVEWFKRAADSNVTAALTRTGMYYVKGTQTIQPNGEIAAGYFYRAAEQGDSTAMHNLAHLCMNGAGIPKNEGSAIYWMILASAVERDSKIKAQMDLTRLEWEAKVPNKVRKVAMDEATARLAKGFKAQIGPRTPAR